jgi:hypothetical protein
MINESLIQGGQIRIARLVIHKSDGKIVREKLLKGLVRDSAILC